MSDSLRKIPEVEMSEISTGYMCSYGVNVNLMRSIPMIDDGLKPVMRRIVFTLYKKYRGGWIKTASAIGDVLHIHPHGDQGMGGVFARMCQPFSNNVPLLESNGNAGNVTTGDDYASPRYHDVRLTQFALDVLFDEFDGKVDMQLSYNEKDTEPIVLPCKFPIVLLNGSSGIGYTLSSDIYPYNLNEVADATIKLLKNPQAKIHLIPDLPTGCDIIVRDEDTFVMQSTFDVDNVNYVITIKNTPYLKYLDDIDDALRHIQDSEDPIKEILSAYDESTLVDGTGDLKYVIRCKPCNLYQVINTLFKRVPGFRTTVSARNMNVVEMQPNGNMSMRHYNTRQILLSWIESRIMRKTLWFQRDLEAKTFERNMLKGKEFMLSPENLNKTIKIFRSCKNKDEIIPKLVEGYKGKVTTSQANYMIDIKLYRLTADEYEKTKKDIEEINKKIDYVQSIVHDPQKICDVIIDEIKDIKKKYGYPRRSRILNMDNGESVNIGVVQILTDGTVLFSETENPEHLSSDITPISGDNVCLIDTKGRFLWIDVNKVPHGKPVTLTSIGKGKMDNCVSVISSIDNDILILTNKGRVKYMPISRIPSNATKKPLLPLSDDEYVVSVLELSDNSDIFIYTSDGMGKRVQTKDLNRVSSIDAAGQYLLKGFDVSGMFVLNSNKPYIAYVTRLGRVRINQAKFLISVKKFADPKSIIKLSSQDDLILVTAVDKDQTITLNHADGRITTVNVDSLPVSTMAMEPVRPKHVPGVKVIRATIS